MAKQREKLDIESRMQKRRCELGQALLYILCVCVHWRSSSMAIYCTILITSSNSFWGFRLILLMFCPVLMVSFFSPLIILDLLLHFFSIHFRSAIFQSLLRLNWIAFATTPRGFRYTENGIDYDLVGLEWIRVE